MHAPTLKIVTYNFPSDLIRSHKSKADTGGVKLWRALGGYLPVRSYNFEPPPAPCFQSLKK